MKIVDSHQHFWDLSKMTYPWMPTSESIIRKNYLPDDLEPDLKSAGISRTIVVQANHTLEETDFLLDLADRTDFVAGVIVWVDLQSDNVYEELKELLWREEWRGLLLLKRIINGV